MSEDTSTINKDSNLKYSLLKAIKNLSAKGELYQDVLVKGADPDNLISNLQIINSFTFKFGLRNLAKYKKMISKWMYDAKQDTRELERMKIVLLGQMDQMDDYLIKYRQKYDEDYLCYEEKTLCRIFFANNTSAWGKYLEITRLHRDNQILFCNKFIDSLRCKIEIIDSRIKEISRKNRISKTQDQIELSYLSKSSPIINSRYAVSAEGFALFCSLLHQTGIQPRGKDSATLFCAKVKKKYAIVAPKRSRGIYADFLSLKRKSKAYTNMTTYIFPYLDKNTMEKLEFFINENTILSE